MSDIFIANIISINNTDSLVVEWVHKTDTKNSVFIGGPNITTLPLSLIPFELRKINTKLSVTFTDSYTATKVDIYEENT